VRAVTKSAVGTSLLAIDTQEIEAHVRALPSVIATSVDRAFPHTLVVKVAAEHPVAVARRSHRAWLLTGSNRVISAVDADAEPGLPRIWLPRRVSVEVGRTLPAAYGPATRALAGLREIHFPGRIKGVRVARGELTFVLRNGLEILLGDSTDAIVKLAVAAEVIPLLDDGAVYLDVSVPERPVSSTYLNSQVEVYSSNTLGP
jgi:cell division septal protein FtsQ